MPGAVHALDEAVGRGRADSLGDEFGVRGGVEILEVGDEVFDHGPGRLHGGDALVDLVKRGELGGGEGQGEHGFFRRLAGLAAGRRRPSFCRSRSRSASCPRPLSLGERAWSFWISLLIFLVSRVAYPFLAICFFSSFACSLPKLWTSVIQRWVDSRWIFSPSRPRANNEDDRATRGEAPGTAEKKRDEKREDDDG